MAKNDLQGTLDLLLLKTLAQNSSLHGYGIVLHIERVSGELLRVEEGSLYPALHRMEQNNWLRSTWALTETNRRAKFYSLTAPAASSSPSPNVTGSRPSKVYRPSCSSSEVTR